MGEGTMIRLEFIQDPYGLDVEIALQPLEGIWSKSLFEIFRLLWEEWRYRGRRSKSFRS